MRLLLLVPGGVDRSGVHHVIPALLGLIEELATRHDVTVVALAHDARPTSYELAGAKVHSLGNVRSSIPGWGSAKQARRLWTILRGRQRSFDVVHGFWFGRATTFALAVGRRWNLPVLASLGGGELVGFPDIHYGGRLSWRARRHAAWALRHADAVTAGSDYALGPISKTRLDAVRVPLLPDLGSFSSADDYVPTREPRLLTVSSVNHVKDPVTMLHALRRIADQIPGVHLDWVGGDTLGGEIERLSARLDLADRVTFHGFQPHAELPRFFQSVSVYVQASRHESQGVAVCEAAAAGLPIVGTNVGTLAELAPQAATAVPPQNPEALAAAVTRLLGSQEQRQELSAHARRWAQGLGQGTTARGFETVYEMLIHRSAGRRAA